MSTHRNRKVTWSPPTGNFVKVNVYGSSYGNPGRARFSGFLRNNCGDWITGFFGFCGLASNLYVELLAIFTGLHVAWNAGFRLLVLESNS